MFNTLPQKKKKRKRKDKKKKSKKKRGKNKNKNSLRIQSYYIGILLGIFFVRKRQKATYYTWLRSMAPENFDVFLPTMTLNSQNHTPLKLFM